jgi:deazaflavin-dependent oxidoreductase (nitroreductase family)
LRSTPDGDVRHNSEAPVAADTKGTGVSRKSRGARLLGRTLRAPGILDRKGTRWLLQALSPAPVIVLVHRGRKSGRVYRTPVEIIVDDPERDELAVAPMWGKDSDWYRNVLAGGLVEVHVRGEPRQVEWRQLAEAERRVALDAYREAHPIYSRIILRMLVRVNGLEGDPDHAVLQQLPMLGLRRIGTSREQ